MHNWFYLTSCCCQLISVGIRRIREERERVLPPLSAVILLPSALSLSSVLSAFLSRLTPQYRRHSHTGSSTSTSFYSLLSQLRHIDHPGLVVSDFCDRRNLTFPSANPQPLASAKTMSQPSSLTTGSSPYSTNAWCVSWIGR